MEWRASSPPVSRGGTPGKEADDGNGTPSSILSTHCGIPLPTTPHAVEKQSKWRRAWRLVVHRNAQNGPAPEERSALVRDFERPILPSRWAGEGSGRAVLTTPCVASSSGNSG